MGMTKSNKLSHSQKLITPPSAKPHSQITGIARFLKYIVSTLMTLQLIFKIITNI